MSAALRVLSVCSVFPSPAEPVRGIFVRSRLQHMAAEAQICVLSPAALVDYARLRAAPFGARGVPHRCRDGRLNVLYPRWWYPPMGGALNAGFLFARLLPAALRLRRAFPFDLIDAHFGYPEGIAAAMLARALGRPLFVTLRGNETMHCRKSGVRRLMAWALRNASRVIAVSERLRQFAISLGADPARAKTIPNGVDSSVYFPQNREQARRQFHIATDARVIVSAGYLIPRKGHHLAVRAVKALRDRGCPTQFLIAGAPGREGACEGLIRQTIAEMGVGDCVRLLGELPPAEVAALMSAADVFCLASSREGWPNVVHEAMACGTPVVATNVGAVPELIPSEQFGLVAAPGDQASLENALHAALRREWDRQAIAAWAHSRSWQRVAREVLEEMRAVISS